MLLLFFFLLLLVLLVVRRWRNQGQCPGSYAEEEYQKARRKASQPSAAQRPGGGCLPTRRRRVVLTRARTRFRNRAQRLGVGGPAEPACGVGSGAARILRAATSEKRAEVFQFWIGSPRARRARTRRPCTAGRPEQRARRPRELLDLVNPH